MNRKICFSLLIVVACGASVVAQTVTPTLANAKLRAPRTPFDPVPLVVVSITAQSGAPGTPAMPIAAADPIIVTFSRTVSSASFDPVSNFVVRNLAGVQVPGFITPLTPGATDDSVYVFTPIGPYGPGVSPAQGFDIDVRVGSFGQRFTFVGLVAQGRSLWYDTGAADPNYLGFVVSPPLSAQPAGTQSTWILEATDAMNPGPGTTGTAGVYIDAAGLVDPNVLSSPTQGIGQKRYFRFRAEFRGNNLTNMAPSYGSVLMGYAF
jgi:hypothetical protein